MKYHPSTIRTLALYALSIVILTYYGIEVCPFLETLSPYELITVFTVAFAISGTFRMLILSRLQSSNELDLQKPWQYLQVDLTMWLLTGILVTGWNAYHYAFPIESGLKVILGCITLGIFSASYLALKVEHELIQSLSDKGNVLTLTDRGKFFSITTKFFIFTILSITVVTTVLLLLIYKDFIYVIDTLSMDKPFEFIWVAREILFVMAILLIGSFAVARQYSRNLKLMFELQLKSFGAVEKGNYETFVPVINHDEFGIIAEQTNQMIVGLKEKVRIEKAFGKYMSPTVAQSVLNSEQETHLGGREVNVAILFTDLRDFTPLSEKCSPREVVEILNEYFTLVVEAVHTHHGVLDKFIGDAAMAVFGLDGKSAHENAILSAFDIQAGLITLNQKLTAQDRPNISNGIGIHCGPVVAGNIGSEERLEYTVIGDAVNTAARLESLTKELPSTLAVSETLYMQSSSQTQNQLIYLQDYALKGKADKIAVYGLPAIN
ncbi:MAG: adenylate/guanylate cyclase domain-containing protein [Candidatus Latescibacteria bacterium]|jgi:adenylate cyclase|nr:adenylate/guanylate cyclase domain-containing protein [Candidatus Latescibacterota bacterium]